MGNIEIVVKMPEEEYDIIKNYTAPMTWVEYLIKNGTPIEQESILDFIKDCKNKIENYGKDYMFTQEEVLNIIERYAIKYTKSFKWQESEEVNGR